MGRQVCKIAKNPVNHPLARGCSDCVCVRERERERERKRERERERER
jgi:hypothetical protein